MTDANRTGPPYFSRYPTDWKPQSDRIADADRWGVPDGSTPRPSRGSAGDQEQDQPSSVQLSARALRACSELVLACEDQGPEKLGYLKRLVAVLEGQVHRLHVQQEASDIRDDQQYGIFIPEEPESGIEFYPVGNWAEGLRGTTDDEHPGNWSTRASLQGRPDTSRPWGDL